MKILLTIAAGLALALSFAADTRAAGQTPEQFLRGIYKSYTSASRSGLAEEDNVTTRRIYEPDLAALIIADYRKMQDLPGEPVLEFDPLVNAQDIDIKGPVGIKIASQTAQRAVAIVTFVNAGTKQTLTYTLVKIAGLWKIHDIDWNGKQTLRGLFRPH